MASWQKNPKNFEPCTREEALAQGRKLYFTGQPCKHGHTAPRYVTTGGCLACLNRFQAQLQTAKNPHSHDLVPYVPIAPFWRSKRLSPEQLAQLDRYVQTCVDTFCTTVLPPLCKTCDGTRYVFMSNDGSTPRRELCPVCVGDIVPTGTQP